MTDSIQFTHEILPGILEKDWESIEKKLEIIKPFAKSVHIDIIDNKFAPNLTFLDPTPFKKYTNDLFFELHMMVEEPIQYLKPWAAAGFKRFLGHVEYMSDQAEFVAEAQLLGEVGLAIDGPTALSAIKVSYEDLDTILLMSIKAGFSGQKFAEDYVKKAAAIREKSTIPLEVDGGINDKTIIVAKEFGINRFVSTSHIFSSPDQKKAFRELALVLGEGH